jgi:hypothetical protein
MEFRLTYQGPLFADRGANEVPQGRLIHKHSIRRHFHEQLQELWNVDSRLKGHVRKRIVTYDAPTGVTTSTSDLDELEKLHEIGGIKWVPLVTDRWGAVCSLDILFLRHEPKGGIIQSGDLDNRINTLFDALRMPEKKEIPDNLVLQNEPSPFFCLLSNDKLITEFRVTADRLLVPNTKPDADVHLVIRVHTFIEDFQKAAFTIGGSIHQ